MRTIILKTNSTKPERKFAEYLKRLHIPFKHRVKICGREIDFLIKDTIVEIDGHLQEGERNQELTKAGYKILHFTNKDIDYNLFKRLQTCQEQIFTSRSQVQ